MILQCLVIISKGSMREGELEVGTDPDIGEIIIITKIEITIVVIKRIITTALRIEVAITFLDLEEILELGGDLSEEISTTTTPTTTIILPHMSRKIIE